MTHKKTSLVKRLVSSSGIVFAILLVIAAITLAAFTTWSPGDPPASDPGDGNISANFLIEARTSDPASPQVGQIWLRTDL
ncbi:MAG: hypothetical protein V2A63_01020 [Patescibacteria group bacterium]